MPTRHTSADFDARNNRVKLRDANATTVYDPDHNYLTKAIYIPTRKTGDVVEVEHQSSFGYDERHRLVSIGHQRCMLTTPAIDPVHSSCSTVTSTGTVSYAYDANDNRTGVNEANGGSTTNRFYCYDALDRLVNRSSVGDCASSTKDETYAYDDAGNLTTFDTDVLASVTFGYNGQGQLCKTGASTPSDCATPNVTYDAAGRTSVYAGWYLTYDTDGRLKTACKSSTCASTADKVEMVYDGEGRRTAIISDPAGAPAAVTREFRYQGDAIVEERVGGVLDRSYLVTYNGHGDAMALWKVDTATGALTLAYSFTYGTWGAPSTATHNASPDLGFRFRYVGEFDVQWDAELSLGLYYMHARHYAPGIGRFLQPDPDRSEANLYAYAANNPATEIDPEGTCFILCVVVVGVMLFGTLEATSEVAQYAVMTPQSQWTGEGFRGAAVSGAISGGISGAIPGGGRIVSRAASKILTKVPKATRAVTKAVARVARPSVTARAHTGPKIFRTRGPNPFAGKSSAQIDLLLRSRGFIVRGRSPQTGEGASAHPRSGRSYHIDQNRHKRAHVDVGRPRTYKGPLPKHRYPMGGPQ